MTSSSGNTTIVDEPGLVLLDDMLYTVRRQLDKLGLSKNLQPKSYVTTSSNMFVEPEDESDSDDFGGNEHNKNYFLKVAPQKRLEQEKKAVEASENGAKKRKYVYCNGCDAPHDRRIKRAKDPTNRRWYCYVCWRAFRTEMYKAAPLNEKWETCMRCTMGTYEKGGRFMEHGTAHERFFCNLCWQGWIGALPQKSDWMKKTTAEIEEEKREQEEWARKQAEKEEARRKEEAKKAKEKEEDEAKGPPPAAEDKENVGPTDGKDEPAAQGPKLPQPAIVESDVTPVSV